MPIDPATGAPSSSSNTRDQRGNPPAGPGVVSPSLRPRTTDRNAAPVVRPRDPQEGQGHGQTPRRDLIPIPAGPAPPRAHAANTAQYWANYYGKHDETPEALREKITLLNWHKKFGDVQAILEAYLNYRRKNQQPWMYAALGLAVQENQGKPELARRYFKFAADSARMNQNPNHLVSVADILFMQKQYDLIGPLLDQAMEKVPHRSEPILMSILLAQATKDPKRMGDSVEKLLALGWPGNDDVLRRDARQHAEKLARTLREEGRNEEADRLLARLPEAEARDLFIRLSWTGDADFDLAVTEPLGATATYMTPRTVFGGSIVKNGYGKHPEEVYVCPRGFDGDYSIKVETIYNNPSKPATQGTLEIITHEGTPQESKHAHTLALGGKTPPPIVIALKGGRRKVVMPLVLPTASAEAVSTKPQAPNPK
jgi:tetratricopeptide (TPR) repeat protein